MSVFTEKETQTEQMPIGIFWDIENISIPKHKSIPNLIKTIRNAFCTGVYYEDDFVAVFDVTKELKQLSNDLSAANVTIVHVPALAKNAVDEKLKNMIRKFCNRYNVPVAILLLSSDINFSPLLTELKYSKQATIFLIHNECVNQGLLNLADRSIIFKDLLTEVPDIQTTPMQLSEGEKYKIKITNLPNINTAVLKRELKKLYENTGGKLTSLLQDSAIIQFRTFEEAERALARITGEKINDVEVRAEKYLVSCPAEKKKEVVLKLVEEILGLFSDQEQIKLNSISKIYNTKYGKRLNFSNSGYKTMKDLINDFPAFFQITGNKGNKVVHLVSNDSSELGESSGLQKAVKVKGGSKRKFSEMLSK